MIIIYIFNNPVIVFLMSILFLWSAIKIVKYLKEKKSFGSIPLVYRVTFLVSLSMIILSITLGGNILITFARNILPILTMIVLVGLYLLVRASIEIFKKIKNKEPIGIKQFVMLFFSLACIDFITIVYIGLDAGLGHSSTEIALAPLRFLFSFIIVVITPIVALLFYNYLRFAKPGKKKRTHFISYGVLIALVLLIALVWLSTAGWPPIVYAARHSHYSLAKFFLDLGADANAFDKHRGSTPLLYTVWNNDEKMARLLVDKGAKAGFSEWFHVCFRNRLEIAKMILENGQDPNIQFTERNTSPLLLAVSSNHPDLVKLLLEYGADVYFVGENKQNALDIARVKGFSRIEQLLLNPRVKHNIDQVKQTNQIRLLQAVSRGQLEHVRTLLDQGADINVKETKSGQTPLISASFKQRKKLAQLLLDREADVHAKDINGETALMAAAGKGNTSIVKMLLEKGADVNTKNNQGQTPLLKIAKNENLDMIGLLLENGADIDAKDKWEETALIIALHKQKLAAAKLLVDKGADIHVKDNFYGRTPLIWASNLGDIKLVKLLLEKGAQVNAEDKQYKTAIVHAAYNNHHQIRELLLKHGADPVYLKIFTKKIEKNQEVEVDNIEIHWTLQQTKDPKTKNLLAAVALGDVNKVNNLLDKEIINKKIYSLNDGTVLSWAAYCNQPRLVKHLIERGANVDARSDHNVTPLIEAAHLGHLEVVKILVQNGADVNAATKKGWTALMWSGKNGRVEVVRFLLQSGADKSPKNHQGKTALEIAEAKGQKEVVKILKEEN
ncbi:ankyrin repeat domain-containing protein [Acidobacteriota bacterium]